MRLLVIDDSLTIRKLVEIAFKGTGVVVEFAVSGSDGIAQATRSAPPEAILLDYVLPDMRGSDVCRALAKDARLAATPIVLMSARSEGVREQFAAYPAVVDFVAKPFERKEITSRIQRAIEHMRRPASQRSDLAPPSAATTAASFSFEQQEAAARALFARLKPHLAQIPQWVAGLGDAAPATYFAKRLLTPEVLEALLAELAPLYAQPAPPAALEDGARLAGQVDAGLLIDLMRMLASGERTGELRLLQGSDRAVVYWRAGAIAAVTCCDPEAYTLDSQSDLGSVPAALRARAEAEQRASGKPLYVTLAEEGAFAAADLKAALQRQGLRVLRRALAAACRFEWREPAALPAWAQAHGGEISVLQVWLEHLRSASSPARKVAQAVPSFGAVFERGERFSHKVRQLELLPAERQILALVDGRASVQEIVDRSGVEPRETVHALFRFAQTGLVRCRATSCAARPKVMLLDPDARGVRRPLAEMLAARPRPFDLQALDDLPDPVAAVLKERPAVALLNVSVAGQQAQRIARALHAEAGSATSLVALLEPGDPRAGGWEDSPYDAVVCKPVHYSEIDRLLPG